MGEYASNYANMDHLQKQKIAVLQISENSQEHNCGKYYLNKVAGLHSAIWLKQTLPRVFSLKPSKILEQLFSGITSGLLVLNLQTIIIVSTPSYLSHFYVGTRKVGQFRITWHVKLSWLTIYWPSKTHSYNFNIILNR